MLAFWEVLNGSVTRRIFPFQCVRFSQHNLCFMLFASVRFLCGVSPHGCCAIMLHFQQSKVIVCDDSQVFLNGSRHGYAR